MPLLDDTRLEKHATAIVNRFFNEKTALTEGVADIAEQDNLNPEQVKRLVESVNNMAFLRKFDGAEDRMAASEFQPADANAALGKMLDAAKELIQCTGNAPPAESSLDGDLTQELPVTRPEAPKLNPLEGEEIVPSEEPKLSSTRVILKLRKTAQLFHDEEYQARVELTEAFQKVATNFSRLDSVSFEEFEKDAFYRWGERSEPFLEMLRTSLRMPTVTYDHAAMTKVARVVDSRAPTMRRFHEMMVYSENANKAQKGLQRVQGYLAELGN